MLISRAPFRVSFTGGGSDIPSFYEKYGGCVLSTTIRKYVYLTINPTFFKNEITLKYSQTETVNDVSKIEHKIFRTVLKDFNLKGVEITSMADIPAGTGLGSSSSFTVALLRLLYTYTNRAASTYKIAKEACNVEINQLGNPIGKQDQFAAAFGGLRFYEFLPDGFVKVEPIIMLPESYRKLENNLCLFFTGKLHDANKILAEESDLLAREKEKIETTKKMCDLTRALKEKFECNDIDALGPILHQNWEMKKSLARGITNPLVDDAYKKGLEAGATGGKLLGAGGGGFILFYCPTPDAKARVKASLSYLKEMPVELDQAGSSIIFMD